MNQRKHYIINNKTSALVSKFDQYGNEFTLVFEGPLTFLVELSPDKIVDNSFKYVGKSLKGAVAGSRHILRKKYKVPIVYSIQNDIVLIQCYRPSERGKVWLVNSQIHHIMSDENNDTIVITKYGHRIHARMRVDKLQDKRNQATFLHKELVYRTNNSQQAMMFE